ncbi:MAG: UDP-N-acetylglucosamine 2-epimerase (non-hydrolyzing) [candidate division WOR-3 bacterium]
MILELRRHPEEWRPVVLVTAQHRRILDHTLELFEISPDYDLNIMQEGQSLFDVTVKTLRGVESVLAKVKPAMVVVQGDTTTALAAALAAFYCRVRVGHVEAGLRTRDKYAPFPEEMNRRLISSLADLHFAPTAWARDNLLREGVPRRTICVTGNTVIDALRLVLRNQKGHDQIPTKGLGPYPRTQKLLLVTAHRRESFGLPLVRICQALKTLARRNPDVEIVYPVHPNPNVRVPVYRLLGNRKRIHLIEPVEYAVFARLLAQSYLVLTDSGGIQEEAPALGKPVLVMRDKTERPEAILAGTARLVGTAVDRIVSTTERLLNSPAAYRKMARATNPFGDGRAAGRIRAALHRYFRRQRLT